jgi:hypothetical protein
VQPPPEPRSVGRPCLPHGTKARRGAENRSQKAAARTAKSLADPGVIHAPLPPPGARPAEHFSLMHTPEGVFRSVLDSIDSGSIMCEAIDVCMRFMIDEEPKAPGWERLPTDIAMSPSEQEAAKMCYSKRQIAALWFPSHFILVDFKQDEKKAKEIVVNVRDSMPAYRPSARAAALDKLAAFIKKRLPNVETVTFAEHAVPAQRGDDCGVEVLKNAAVLLNVSFGNAGPWSRAKIRGTVNDRRDVLLAPLRQAYIPPAP